jgi:hypothetical protein
MRNFLEKSVFLLQTDGSKMTLMVWLGGAQRTIRQNGYGFLDQNSTFVILKVAKEVGNCASVDACHVRLFRQRRLLDA